MIIGERGRNSFPDFSSHYHAHLGLYVGDTVVEKPANYIPIAKLTLSDSVMTFNKCFQHQPGLDRHSARCRREKPLNIYDDRHRRQQPRNCCFIYVLIDCRRRVFTLSYAHRDEAISCPTTARGERERNSPESS